jgi:hypothetical protein
MERLELLGDFPVLEFRRYRIAREHRARFAHYFDSYFPEAIQQLGGIVPGQFLERDNDEGFTWIRGFHDVPARAAVNAALYEGPVWKEHRERMNEHMLDHTNVLLLAPLDPQRGIAVLRAVDPVRDRDSPRGVAVAQVFAVKSGSIASFVEVSAPIFEAYRSAGIHEAGVLRTLDVPNNYARLPFRTDGEYVVWLGVAASDATLDTGLRPAVRDAREMLADSRLLKGTPELIILDPTPRSRLRWVTSA